MMETKIEKYESQLIIGNFFFFITSTLFCKAETDAQAVIIPFYSNKQHANTSPLLTAVKSEHLLTLCNNPENRKMQDYNMRLRV